MLKFFKVSRVFPSSFKEYKKWEGKIDVILVYSVIQYIFSEGNIYSFLDKCLNLLNEDGQMLIGDIPNISMRKRFFDSKNGIKFHQDFMKTNEIPQVRFNKMEPNHIDDSVVIRYLERELKDLMHGYYLKRVNFLLLTEGKMF